MNYPYRACLEATRHVRVLVNGHTFVVSSWDFGATMNSYSLKKFEADYVIKYLKIAKLEIRPDNLMELYNVDRFLLGKLYPKERKVAYKSNEARATP